MLVKRDIQDFNCVFRISKWSWLQKFNYLAIVVKDNENVTYKFKVSFERLFPETKQNMKIEETVQRKEHGTTM